MGELLALRWRDVDFELRAIQVRASYTHRQLDTAKNRTGRIVPMIEAVATALAQLEQREYFTRPDDLVFASAVGSHLDDSALRRRYKRAREAAGLRTLRFHDLRHTFGTHAIRTVDPRELREWMGHADFATTQIYLSYKPRAEAAERLARAFELIPSPASFTASSTQLGV
jgi:integrase